MIQSSTNFEVIIIKEVNKYKVLVEYGKNNCLYSKGKKAIMYKNDLRPLNIYDFIEEEYKE